MYRRILVPTDGSRGTEAAVAQAIGLATAYDASLHTLYVVDATAGPDTGVVGALDVLREAGEWAVEAVVEQATAAGVETVEASVTEGTPHRAIVEYAEDHDVDHIVMGTHGRTGLDRYFLGSVAETVVRQSDTPVMTVRLSDGPPSAVP